MPARKHSRKREAILECVRSTKCHPTAEWVYQQLKPEIPDLSLGTVYRNLALFQEEGLIDSVGFVENRERFDGCTRQHAHFICSGCGAVLDLELPDLPDSLREQVEKQLNVSATGYRLQYTGLCAECQNKKK